MRMKCSTPEEISSKDEYAHVLRHTQESPCSQLRLIAPPNSPTLSEDEQSPIHAIDQNKNPSKALRQLKLTDRFHDAPLDSIKTPTFSAVQYARPTTPTPDNECDRLSTEAEGTELKGNDPDSSYSSSSSALISPTTSSLKERLTLLSDLFDPAVNIGVRTHLIGRKNAGRGVKCKMLKALCDEEKAITLKLERCNVWAKRVLDQISDLPSERVCGWHSIHRGEDEGIRAFRILKIRGVWEL
ncbi:hypothetical protein E8E12_002742 [Didymella heteroderae]|uniref:Uncharacterized protein n=1 Tax=Didymella heteroderae TaxID=1769908 RepID=A0A9P5BW28_9PLEO|nr:hypothetical protein E8E12_002742 [Didymella heteroderae]